MSKNIAGRKPKKNVIRDKSGKSRGEPMEIAPEVLAVRERHLTELGVALTFNRMEQTKFGSQWVEKHTATDALSGFSLGIMLLRHRADKTDPGSISQAQYDAGDIWCRIVHRHASIMGYSLTTPSSGMFAGGRGSGLDPDEETIERIRRQWRDCYNALMAASREHNAPIWRLTYSIAVENKPAQHLTALDYGHLRTGLNALARVLS